MSYSKVASSCRQLASTGDVPLSITESAWGEFLDLSVSAMQSFSRVGTQNSLKLLETTCMEVTSVPWRKQVSSFPRPGEIAFTEPAGDLGNIE